MANTPAAEPTSHTLSIEDDGEGFLIHVTGSKPIRLGDSEAARLARVLSRDLTPPYSIPTPDFHDEPAEDDQPE